MEDAYFWKVYFAPLNFSSFIRTRCFDYCSLGFVSDRVIKTYLLYL